MTAKRIVGVAMLGVAVLLVGGVAIIHAATDSAPSGATPAAAPPRTERVVPAPAPAPPRTKRVVPAPAPAPPLAPNPVASLPARMGAQRDGPAEAIKVAFKMDSRLTRGLHMGARWVSPPTYVGTHEGNLFTVQARARGAGAGGSAVRDPTWLPAEPDMVAVTPDSGREVEITVLREGRSTLTVAEDGVSRTLVVNAVHRGGVWRVEFSQ